MLLLVNPPFSPILDSAIPRFGGLCTGGYNGAVKCAVGDCRRAAVPAPMPGRGYIEATRLYRAEAGVALAAPERMGSEPDQLFYGHL